MYNKNLIPAGTQIPLFDGYVATKLEEGDGPSYAYEVIGPRTSWLLMRNQKSPELLFVIKADTSAKSWKIRGNGWFREKQETQEIVTAHVIG